MGTPLCNYCHEKPIKPHTRGLKPKYCSSKCANRAGSRYQRLARYGLTESEYLGFLLSQNGVCAVCRETLGCGMVLDRDEATKQVRGALCPKCWRDVRMSSRYESKRERLLSYLNPTKKPPGEGNPLS